MSNEKLTVKELKALFFIRNALLYEQRNPSHREIKEHLGFGSPRSSYLLVDRLVAKGYLEKTPAGNFRLKKDIDRSVHDRERVVELPLVGSAPCGLPFLAEENTEAWIPVSQKIAKPGAQYFLLRAVGNSMDRSIWKIQDGDLLVVRQQPVANNGEVVIALIGDSATIKEFQKKGDKVLLVPRSSDSSHKPIIMDKEFMVQGVVVTTIPDPF